MVVIGGFGLLGGRRKEREKEMTTFFLENMLRSVVVFSEKKQEASDGLVGKK